MKKILLFLIALTASLSINSQEIILDENGKIKEEVKKEVKFTLPEKMEYGNATKDEAQKLIDSRRPSIKEPIKTEREKVFLENGVIVFGDRPIYKEIYWEGNKANTRTVAGKVDGNKHLVATISFLIISFITVFMFAFPKSISIGHITFTAPKGILNCKPISRWYFGVLILMLVLWFFVSFNTLMLIAGSLMLLIVLCGMIHYALLGEFAGILGLLGLVAGIIMGNNMRYEPENAVALLLLSDLIPAYITLMAGIFFRHLAYKESND